MKKNKWLIYVGIALVAWYYWKQKKSGSGPVIKLPGGGGSTTTSGASAQEAASEAKTIVADVVDKTTFLPDLMTDRDLYLEDQKTCK
jgi:hypothetical protein